MGDTVLVHDLDRPHILSTRVYTTPHLALAHLSSTKLQIGGVDFPTQHFVESRSTGQDNRLTLDLNRPLTKTEKVCTDTDRPSGDERDGENVVVCAGSLSSNETGTFETLDTKAVLETNDVRDNVSALSIDFDLVGADNAGCQAIIAQYAVVNTIDATTYPRCP